MDNSKSGMNTAATVDGYSRVRLAEIEHGVQFLIDRVGDICVYSPKTKSVLMTLARSFEDIMEYAEIFHEGGGRHTLATYIYESGMVQYVES